MDRIALKPICRASTVVISLGFQVSPNKIRVRFHFLSGHGPSKSLGCKPHQVLFDVLCRANFAGTKHQPMAFGRPLIEQWSLDLQMMNSKRRPLVVCEEVAGHRLNIFDLRPSTRVSIGGRRW